MVYFSLFLHNLFNILPVSKRCVSLSATKTFGATYYTNTLDINVAALYFIGDDYIKCFHIIIMYIYYVKSRCYPHVMLCGEIFVVFTCSMCNLHMHAATRLCPCSSLHVYETHCQRVPLPWPYKILIIYRILINIHDALFRNFYQEAKKVKI